MAISISTAFQTALDGDDREGVGLFVFEFGTGTYAFWTGAGEMPYNGLTYMAGGSVIEIDSIVEKANGAVGRMNLHLNADPEKGISDDVLIRLFDEDWHNKKVLVQYGLLDPDTGQIAHAMVKFRGRLEHAEYVEGEVNRIEAKCVSTSIDLSRSGGGYRNDSTQKLIDPNDTSLEGIGTLGGALEKDAKWGQA
ncbi:hypothetical protein [Maritalea myrionectae]|uniref:hypothetical protein n=1 Tax=Maritalea myrionectae TaxID=454601 RepID=UPI00040DBE4D|nr:hypothetical protein [Maritalea myrionectae]